jgi:TRAP-type mannitol/chloroaromatic compound transport system permease small subunit
VRVVEAVSRLVGRAAMYGVFAMMAVLLYSAATKSISRLTEGYITPSLWTLEIAQFLMVAYFLAGGGYSMQLGSHVRMDLLYGRWRLRTRLIIDCATILFLIFYLALLLYGGISSTRYALEYGERSYSAWAPPMAPIKIVMTCGVALMLLQAVATFFKDLAAILGRKL